MCSNFYRESMWVHETKREVGQPVSMFDKFHLTFNFKSKVSSDVLKNKNESQLTSTFYSKMSLQFLLTQYFRKTSILNNQYAILICKPNKVKSKKVKKSRKWLLIAFCMESPLSHCLVLFPVSLAIYDHRLNSRLQKKIARAKLNLSIKWF